MLPEHLGERLWLAMTQQRAEIGVAHDGERMQPVFALLSRGLLPSLLTYLQAGGRKIDTWYAQHRVALADFSQDRRAFLNVNTEEDRLLLEQVIRPAAS